MFNHNTLITRIYTAENGLSYFEDVLPPTLYPIGKKQRVSQILGAARLFEFDADFQCDWHISSKRCYYLYLQGRQAVEVSGGGQKEFGPGDIILAEDLSGKGHRSWSTSHVPGRAVIITLS
ncbi:MAG: hypothetical protein K0Q74_436 [Gammaproteobacteria bacterium]|nr:hypothetical protein [Gammaproteobacteria bacterium]